MVHLRVAALARIAALSIQLQIGALSRRDLSRLSGSR
jgi:hypothetical protein